MLPVVFDVDSTWGQPRQKPCESEVTQCAKTREHPLLISNSFESIENRTTLGLDKQRLHDSTSAQVPVLDRRGLCRQRRSKGYGHLVSAVGARLGRGLGVRIEGESLMGWPEEEDEESKDCSRGAGFGGIQYSTRGLECVGLGFRVCARVE